MSLVAKPLIIGFTENKHYIKYNDLLTGIKMVALIDSEFFIEINSNLFENSNNITEEYEIIFSEKDYKKILTLIKMNLSNKDNSSSLKSEISKLFNHKKINHNKVTKFNTLLEIILNFKMKDQDLKTYIQKLPDFMRKRVV